MIRHGRGVDEKTEDKCRSRGRHGKQLGFAGESAAVEFLVGRGMRLIGTNVRVGRDEIDAIFADGESSKDVSKCAIAPAISPLYREP